MKRRLLTLGVAATAVTALTGAGAATAASPGQTLGPDVVGWWSTANRNAALPAVAPPDVGAKDLYVSGANAAVAQLGQSVAAPVAIAALRFRLPDGADAKQLRLRLAGTHPPAVTMTACRALESFTAAHGGPWDKAPAYDCTTSGTARLTSDGQVVIDDVDGLRDGSTLAVVLVPGPLDRVVIAPPDARTLSVTGSTMPAGGLAPTPSSPPAAASVGTAASTSQPDPVALPAGPPPGMQAPSAAAPVVAAPERAPGATAPAAEKLPARPWQALLLTMLIALLAFVALVRQWGRGEVAGSAAVRGVGRFRGERSGTVPDLA